MDMKTKPLPEKVKGLRVNGPRLWDSLMELAQIGATPKGGVCRLTLTDLDKQGRDLVSRWATEAGMTITIDKIGNGFLRRPGRNNDLPPVGWVSMWLPVTMGGRLLSRPGRRMKPLPILSMVTVMPASRAQRVTRSRPCLSSSDSARRQTPPLAVAPICASSISESHRRWPSMRNAAVEVFMSMTIVS